MNTCLLSLSVDVDSALFVDGVASALALAVESSLLWRWSDCGGDRDEEDLVVVDSSVG